MKRGVGKVPHPPTTMLACHNPNAVLAVRMLARP